MLRYVEPSRTKSHQLSSSASPVPRRIASLTPAASRKNKQSVRTIPKSQAVGNRLTAVAHDEPDAADRDETTHTSDYNKPSCLQSRTEIHHLN